jgi:GTP cyclohydrolase I
MKIDKLLAEQLGDLDHDHPFNSAETPLRADAFERSDAEKIEAIEQKVWDVLHLLGMDLTDDSLKGTPKQIQIRSNAGRKEYYHLFDL